MRWTWVLLAAFGVLVAHAQQTNGANNRANNGVVVRDLVFRGAHYAVVSVDLNVAKLRLYWKDQNNAPYLSFSKLERDLARRGVQLLAVMNAGIFDTGYRPLGLHVENGLVLRPISVRRSGYGNFYLQPNGVFFVEANGKAGILETSEFVRSKITPRLATQSGPLLLRRGQVHAAFRVGSSNALVRNAIALESRSKLHFVVSQDWVNFDDLARFCLTVLNSQNALYLDGTISRLYAPGSPFLGDGLFAGMLAVVR